MKKETKKMIGYKGFNSDMTCRNFQFEEGKTYKEKTASLCNRGFHFCENPLDTFGYYAPTEKFHKIIAEDVSDETEYDSKRVAKKITIGAELSLKSICDLGIKFILSKIDFKNKEIHNTGNYSAASNTGYQSAASVSGKESVAMAIGFESKAMGAKGCWIVLSEWEEKSDEYHIKDVQCVKVDGKKIKANTYYMLKEGKFVETNEK